MPSPFPGMDPYLEDPVLWPGLHQRFITYLSDTLNAILPAGYVSNIGERLTVSEPDRDIYPDAAVFERTSPRTPPAGEAAAAVLDRDPPWLISVEPEDRREPYIEILTVRGDRQVVTVVEVLSPAHKAADSRSREQYRAKQRQVLASPVNLVEIDLLRAGQHTVAVPRDRLLHRGSYDYLVSVSRGLNRAVCEVWGFTLRQRLPRISLPLAGSDPDVVLDLQPLLERCHDLGFARLVDYRGEPTPPLPGADAEWADALLREKGLRP